MLLNIKYSWAKSTIHNKATTEQLPLISLVDRISSLIQLLIQGFDSSKQHIHFPVACGILVSQVQSVEGNMEIEWMFTFFRSEKKLHVFPLCGIGTNILFIWNIWKQMENCFLFLVIKTVFCIPVGSTSADSESAEKKGQLYYATKHKELENPLILVLSGVL